MRVTMNEDNYSEKETARRADAALKRMLNTPHKPHAPLKAKQRPSRARVASRKAKKSA